MTKTLAPLAEDHTYAAYAYAQLVHNPEAVRRSYAVFELETVEQWNDIINTFTVDFHDGDMNYSSSVDMFSDLSHAHLWTYSTNVVTDQIPDDHPMLWTITDAHGDTHLLNDIFRAVHDINGHWQARSSFSLTGEYKAWLAHRQMYSPSALQALWCETRGQSAWTNRFANHADLPLKDRPFASQKAGLAPLSLV